MPRSLRTTFVIVAAVYVCALIVALLSPTTAVGDALIEQVSTLGVHLHVPSALIERSRIEFGLNVLAFVPLTLLGSLARPAVSLSTWVALGFGGSLLVEAFQVLLPQRSATPADVVANTIGAALGALAACALRRSVRQ